MFHPKSKLVLLKNCGHQIMVDNPIDANAQILSMTHGDKIAKEYQNKRSKIYESRLINKKK